MLQAWPCCWPMYISSRPLNGCTASRRHGACRLQVEAKGRRASRRASSSRLDTWERCGVQCLPPLPLPLPLSLPLPRSRPGRLDSRAMEMAGREGGAGLVHRVATAGAEQQAALLHTQRAAGSPDTAPSSAAKQHCPALASVQLQVRCDQLQHSPYRLTCLTVVAAARA